MKTYVFYTTTNDSWEYVRESYIVSAESKEEAKKIFVTEGWYDTIDEIEELDLTVKGQVKIGDGFVE